MPLFYITCKYSAGKAGIAMHVADAVPTRISVDADKVKTDDVREE